MSNRCDSFLPFLVAVVKFSKGDQRPPHPVLPEWDMHAKAHLFSASALKNKVYKELSTVKIKPTR